MFVSVSMLDLALRDDYAGSHPPRRRSGGVVSLHHHHHGAKEGKPIMLM